MRVLSTSSVDSDHVNTDNDIAIISNYSNNGNINNINFIEQNSNDLELESNITLNQIYASLESIHKKLDNQSKQLSKLTKTKQQSIESFLTLTKSPKITNHTPIDYQPLRYKSNFRDICALYETSNDIYESKDGAESKNNKYNNY